MHTIAPPMGTPMITERIGKSITSAARPHERVEQQRRGAARDAGRVAPHVAVLHVAQRARQRLATLADAVDRTVDDPRVDHAVEEPGEPTEGSVDQLGDALVVPVRVTEDRRDDAEAGVERVAL